MGKSHSDNTGTWHCTFPTSRYGRGLGCPDIDSVTSRNKPDRTIARRSVWRLGWLRSQARSSNGPLPADTFGIFVLLGSIGTTGIKRPKNASGPIGSCALIQSVQGIQSENSFQAVWKVAPARGVVPKKAACSDLEGNTPLECTSDCAGDWTFQVFGAVLDLSPTRIGPSPRSPIATGPGRFAGSGWRWSRPPYRIAPGLGPA